MSRRKTQSDPYNHRLSIVVPNDLYDRFYKQFEWGERNRVLVKVIEWIVNKIDEHGRDALFLLLREGDLDSLMKYGKQVQAQAQDSREEA